MLLQDFLEEEGEEEEEEREGTNLATYSSFPANYGYETFPLTTAKMSSSY